MEAVEQWQKKLPRITHLHLKNSNKVKRKSVVNEGFYQKSYDGNLESKICFKKLNLSNFIIT